jgi:predicted phage terminase large subunit-like protein
LKKLPGLEEIRTERARRSLREFIRQAWHVVEPATPFVGGWHLDAVCEHLEWVSAGEIRRLVINVPPRTTKSLSVAVMWPSWEWISRPSIRWVFSSYALQLSVRDSVKCRRLIESPWYQQRWGHVYQLTSDQNVKSRFENDRAGFRMATSVDSGVTGEGGERIVVDDPHNVREAESEATRLATLEWWDQVMSTRLNDPRTGTMVIVMQRVHHEDLAGHVLEKGGWEHLCLPMEYEPGRMCVVHRKVGDQVIEVRPDPRTEEGELLCPERMGPEDIATYKRDLGPRGYAGQYQQRPTPIEGGMFKREWWGRYNLELMIQAGLKPYGIFVDSAFKDGVANDFTDFAVWGTLGGHYYRMGEVHAKMEFPELIQTGRDLYAKWRVPLYVEDKASGISAIQTWRRRDGNQPAIPVVAVPAASNESKLSRAEGQTPLVAAGLCHIPEDAPWASDFIEEHAGFPNYPHDDRVDTTAMALRQMSKVGEIVGEQKGCTRRRRGR